MTAPRFMAALDLDGKPCVVIGGGGVAARRVGTLLNAGAQVTVISPALGAALALLRDQGKIRYLPRRYTSGDLEGAWLAVAATNARKTNHAVYEEATGQHTWINVVDLDEESSVAIPAVVDRGRIRIGITTAGLHPALARALRDLVADAVEPAYDLLAEAMGSCRRDVQRLLPDDGQRRQFWETVIGAEALDLARAGRAGNLRQHILTKAEERVQAESRSEQ